VEKKITVGHLLGIIFLVALIIRIAFILTLDNSVDVWGDWWDELGWSLAQGKGFQVLNPYFSDAMPFYSWRAPGFPIFLAIIYRLFGHSFFAAKIALALLSALTAVLLYALGKEIFNKKTGILAAGIYTIYPASIFWTGYLAPETLASLLIILLTLFAVKSIKSPHILLPLFTGIVLSTLILTRSIGLLLIPVIPAFFFFHKKKKAWKPMLLFFCGLLCLMPWTVRNWIIQKSFVPVSAEGEVVLYIANNERSLGEASGFYHNENIEEFRGMSEIEIDRKFYAMAFSFITKNPKTYARLVLDRFIRFWRLYPHTISGPGTSYTGIHILISIFTETPILLLGICGLFLSKRRWRDLLFPYLILTVFSFSHILVRTTIRYRFPLMGLAILFTAYFLVAITQRSSSETTL